MESEEDIPCLKMKPGEIGIIKEAPAMRWYHGQSEWDKKYKLAAARVVKKRKKLQARADVMIQNALDQGLVHYSFKDSDQTTAEERGKGLTITHKSSTGEIQEDRRWGPLDLDHERPSPSAIAGRRDTVSQVFSANAPFC